MNGKLMIYGGILIGSIITIVAGCQSLASQNPDYPRESDGSMIPWNQLTDAQKEDLASAQMEKQFSFLYTLGPIGALAAAGFGVYRGYVKSKLANKLAKAITTLHNESTEGATSFVKDEEAKKTFASVTGEKVTTTT